MNKHYKATNFKPVQFEDPKRPTQSRTFLKMAEEMHEKFPQLSRKECLEKIIEAWRKGKKR